MIRVRQIKVPIRHDSRDYITKILCKKLRIDNKELINYKITKRSIDARDKKNIMYIYELDVMVVDEKKILIHNKNSNIFLPDNVAYKLSVTGDRLLKSRPVIIGSGPAGLLCAYMLSLLGFRPLIIERGEKVEDRVKTVEEFFKHNKLNPESNVQFGEGGAGTFSDGKLNTLTKDRNGRCKKVFEIFVENGAPEEIMYSNKPHIGTDILRKVIINIRNKIIDMGGEFKYNSCLTDVLIKNDKVCGIEINHGETIATDIVVLAIGHSARDTFYMLNSHNILMRPKNFAVGLRIEHPREMIDFSQYGETCKILDAASYKLTYKATNGRSVYSFCMCPGGFVVNASSENERLCVNGMSNFARDERNSNSAIVVNVMTSDFNDDLFGGLEFQRKIEKNAYQEGKGLIPIQLLNDFMNDRMSKRLGDVIPNTKGNYSFANLNSILPPFITDAIREALPVFGTKIAGFDRDDAVLLGVESRTSSPVVIVRDDTFESSTNGLYPCGEGAGYAGGITTAAIDGIKVAEAICSKYKI